MASHKESNPSIAMYFDGSYSVIYRVSALKEIATRRGLISANLQENAKMLQEAGYLLCSDTDLESALCEIEQIYGGNYPFPRPQKTGWFRRLFGR